MARLAVRRKSDEDECRYLDDGMMLIADMSVTCASSFANNLRHDFSVHKRSVQQDLFVFAEVSFRGEEQEFVTEDLASYQ